MRKEPDRDEWRKKLLVEGNDDLHVIAHIRNACQIEDNFEIIDCESINKINKKLLSYFKAANMDVIAIVVDADATTENVDDALKARWDSLSNLLVKQGYTVPKHPEPNGIIIQRIGRLPRIGIWLMPDNFQRPGMLENFVATLIPTNDVLKPIAERVLSEIENLRDADESRKWFKPVHRPKALIYTWLAWQDEPGRPMGVAIKARMLDHNSELCQRFVSWLNLLFNT